MYDVHASTFCWGIDMGRKRTLSIREQGNNRGDRKGGRKPQSMCTADRQRRVCATDVWSTSLRTCQLLSMKQLWLNSAQQHCSLCMHVNMCVTVSAIKSMQPTLPPACKPPQATDAAVANTTWLWRLHVTFAVRTGKGAGVNKTRVVYSLGRKATQPKKPARRQIQILLAPTTDRQSPEHEFDTAPKCHMLYSPV